MQWNIIHWVSYSAILFYFLERHWFEWHSVGLHQASSVVDYSCAYWAFYLNNTSSAFLLVWKIFKVVPIPQVNFLFGEIWLSSCSSCSQRLLKTLYFSRWPNTSTKIVWLLLRRFLIIYSIEVGVEPANISCTARFF
jgi:hypothetical protein